MQRGFSPTANLVDHIQAEEIQVELVPGRFEALTWLADSPKVATAVSVQPAGVAAARRVMSPRHLGSLADFAQVIKFLWLGRRGRIRGH